MRQYAAEWKAKGHTIQYIESHQKPADIRVLIPWLRKKGVRQITCCDPTDRWLRSRMEKGCADNDIQFTILPSPNFLGAAVEVIAGRKQPMYFQTDFYIRQRKKYGWLMDTNGKPMGGQWSYDADNRKPLPKGITFPKVNYPKPDTYLAEAIRYVQHHFPNNYGDVHTQAFPTNRADSLTWLDEFLSQRFDSFGQYEDAMHPTEHFLCHSGLTPMLNTGLLSPTDVIERTLSYAKKHEIPLASTEGFLRQVAGWREFIRLVYEQAGNKQRTRNYWGFSRKIPESFWTGETGIVPVDAVIRKLLQTGYSHHIERLMILGNFMLLCEFDPDEVYRWFMTLYIDAYDWVMVPNIYGMTQFADGGLMTTKPYISGSNYLMKMGKWEKGNWQAIWDGLFWRFLSVHRDFFSQNPRLGMLLKTWDKMDPAKKNSHLLLADEFLKGLDT